MRPRGRALAGCLVAISLLVAPASGKGADSGGLSVAPDALARASDWRSAHGLRSDADYVAASFVDTTTFAAMEYDVPLTSAEAKGLHEREADQQLFGPARKWALDQGSSAGTYTDQANGGIPVFLFTGNTSTYVASIAALLPSGMPFRIESAARTLKDLEALRGEVDARWSDLEKQGIDVSSTGIDPRTNSVIVGVQELPDGSRLALERQFPVGIVVRNDEPSVLDSCTSRSACGSPMKGGLKIVSTVTGEWCTSAWIGELSNYSPAHLRVVTAGHCISLNGGTGSTKTWTHNGSTLGYATVSTWASGADADVGVISLTNSGQTANLFYASDAADIRPFTSYPSLAEVGVGDAVCRGGARTGYRCGYVHLIDVSRDVDGRRIGHQIEVDFDASPGDSGAPYFLGQWAYGIHSDSTDDTAPAPRYAWYSPYIWAAIAVSNVDICLDADC
jgi:hypothetical protein